MLRKVRIVSQIFFLLLFCFLFLKLYATLLPAGGSWLAWYLRLNPLETLITSIASRSVIALYIIPGAVVLIMTVVLGRFFCGMICPLGTTIDIFDKLIRGKEKINPALKFPVKFHSLKYMLLFVFLILAVFGVTFPLFVDPLSIMPRFFALMVLPELKFITRLFISDTAVKSLSPVMLQGAYAGSFATFMLLAVILGGAFLDRRFWCQYVCPSGAFFGILSRLSLFTRKITGDKCIYCGICSKRTCPTHAIIGEKYDKTSTAECILCGRCTSITRSCNSFGFKKPTLIENQKPDITRRELFAGIAVGLLFMPVLVRKHPKKKPYIPGPVRPPGAVEEAAFISRCITCGACIRACPENALHPGTISHDGLLSWNTPKLVPRIGFCKKECAQCSSACPTGALIPLTLQQKETTKIGTAVITRTRCRAWTQQAVCLTCKLKCPYTAIDTQEITVNGTAWNVPVVDNFKCMGCGVCEYYCPVQHEAAIEVFSHLEKRIAVYKKAVPKSI